jgi:hypothetical protein
MVRIPLTGLAPVLVGLILLTDASIRMLTFNASTFA